MRVCIEALFQPFEHLCVTLGASGRVAAQQALAGAAECGCPLVKAALQLVELGCSCSRAASVCALRSSERISCTAASCSFASSIFSESCAFASASCSLASPTRSANCAFASPTFSVNSPCAFLHAVGQIGQTDKCSLGQLLTQLGPPARADDRVPRAPCEIECAAYGYDHIADKCRRKQNVDHDQSDKRQTEHQLSIGG